MKVKNKIIPQSKKPKLGKTPVKNIVKKHVPKYKNKHLDLRYFENDSTLTEKEKIVKRKDKLSFQTKPNQSRSYFDDYVPKKVDKFSNKYKSLNKFDEGVSESEDESDENIKLSKPRTLEDKIRESKLKKFERQENNEKINQIGKEIENMHRDCIINSNKIIENNYKNSLMDTFALLSKAPVVHAMVNEIKKPDDKLDAAKNLMKSLERKGVIIDDHSDEEKEETLEDHLKNYIDESEESVSDINDKSDEDDVENSDEDSENNDLLEIENDDEIDEAEIANNNSDNEKTKRIKLDDNKEGTSSIEEAVSMIQTNHDLSNIPSGSVSKMCKMTVLEAFTVAINMKKICSIIIDALINLDGEKLFKSLIFFKHVYDNLPTEEYKNKFFAPLVGIFGYVFVEDEDLNSNNKIVINENAKDFNKDDIIPMRQLQKCENNLNRSISILFHQCTLIHCMLDDIPRLISPYLLVRTQGYIEMFKSSPEFQLLPEFLQVLINQINTKIDDLNLVLEPKYITRKIKLVQLLDPDFMEKVDPKKDMEKAKKKRMRDENRKMRRNANKKNAERANQQLEKRNKDAAFRKRKVNEILGGL